MLETILICVGILIAFVGLVAAAGWAVLSIILGDDDEEIEDDACCALFEAHRREQRELAGKIIVPERGEGEQIVGEWVKL